MKKVLLIGGIVFILLLGALLLIPVFFKDEIIALVKTQANKGLKATLNFADADLSLISSFPRLHLSLDSVSIVGRTPQNDTLLAVTRLGISVDLWSYIANDKLDILSASLQEPRVYAHVYPDSTTNWDIFEKKPGEEPSVTVGGEDPNAKISIDFKEYEIENGTLIYEDEVGDMMAMIRNLNHSGSGDFTDELFTLETETSGVVAFRMGNVYYLNDVDTKLDMDLGMDMKNSKFTFKENKLQLNHLPISFNGFVAMPEGQDGIDIDMSFKAQQTEFRYLLSLIPAIYAKDFNKLQSSGTMACEGVVKGRKTETRLPAFTLKMLVGNGSFRYPDLPRPVTNVQLDLAVSNPGGTADNTVIDLQRLHVQFGDDPFDMRMIVRTPVSDPYIDATMKGRLNLGALAGSVPLDKGTELGGVIIADVQARGHMSALDNKRFSDFTATGVMVAQNVVYATPSMPEKVIVRSAHLAFSPQAAALSNLSVSLGKSDISGSGRIDNIMSYMLTDAELRGSLSLASNYFNLNPWLGLDGKATPSAGAAAQAPAPQAAPGTTDRNPELPDKVDFTMSGNFKEIIYDNLTLRNVKGAIALKNKVMTMQNASMDMLGGSMTMSGTYDTRVPERPKSKFAMSVKNFGIAESFNAFTTLQSFTPFLAYMKGSFDASTSLETELTSDLEPILPTLGSVGSLLVEKIRIEGFKPFVQAASLLNIAELSNPTLVGVTPKYEIRNGRFFLPPMNFKLGKYPAKVSGSNGLDKTLDYVMTITLPVGGLQKQTNTALSKLLKTDISAMKSSTVDVAVLIKGTVDNPQISTSLADVVQSQIDDAAKALEEVAKQRLEEEKRKIEEKLKEEEAKLREKARQAEDEAKRKIQEEQEKLRQKAKEEEDRLRQKAKEEEEKAKKKLEEELNKRNPFRKP